jgi:GntR family transcriptional regulator
MVLDDGPTPLYHQLKSAIENRIRSRELKEKERLPSETELCQEFGVSRTTVRQALSELLRDGLIYRERGRGTFISEGARLKRPVLKGRIENLMASGVGTRIKVLSYKEAAFPKEVTEIIKTRTPQRACRLEFVRSLPAGPQAYSLIYFPLNLGRMISPEEIKETTEIILLVEDKLKIKAQGAHQTIDVGLADKVVARNLSVRLRTPLLIVHREYFTKNGSLLFLAKTCYRPDRYRYQIELSRT